MHLAGCPLHGGETGGESAPCYGMILNDSWNFWMCSFVPAWLCQAVTCRVFAAPDQDGIRQGKKLKSDICLSGVVKRKRLVVPV